jgi:hypothetical protein
MPEMPSGACGALQQQLPKQNLIAAQEGAADMVPAGYVAFSLLQLQLCLTVTPQ